MTVGATEAVGDAAAGAAGVDGSDVSDDERFIPPTTPPTIAAAMMRARRTMKIVQNVRLRIPHILRGFGSGGRGISSSMIFAFGGVNGVSGTIVVPTMVEVIVDSIGESMEVGESLPLSSTLISFSWRYTSLLSRGRFSWWLLSGSRCLSVLSIALVST